ncbi:MAG: PhzF family phenazine biosynthesis protein [Candidatus Eremiobacteraeota bacterium]|nr:PhzF family phenazine biosynthesis protein [Candidatus Eremiobacteraeota bacterium]
MSSNGAHRLECEYHLVDVFTQTPFEGNGLAVFPDARSLDAGTMQKIAREMNLSETTFVFPPTGNNAVARVRIFTPAYEMEFAGHPTIGTAYVLRMLGKIDAAVSTFTFEENVGLVPLRVDGGDDPLVWLTTPPIKKGDTFDRGSCVRALGLTEDDLLPDVPCELYSAGNPNIYIPLRDAAAVDRAAIDSAGFHELLKHRSEPTCLFLFTPTSVGAYSRMFSLDLGINEDPATGSATGPLAAFMMDHKLVAHGDGTRFYSEQGKKMGRRSILHVLVRGDYGADGIDVGGHVVPIASATMKVELLSGGRA